MDIPISVSFAFCKRKMVDAIFLFARTRGHYLLFTSFFIVISSFNVAAQNNKIVINPTFGISWRSTPMNFFNFQGIQKEDLTLPYNYERNIQGFALDPGIQITLSSIGLEYNPRLRYDYIHHGYDFATRKGLPDTKGFLIDHNFNFFIRKKIIYGTGFSIVNSGAGYQFENPINVHRYHNIEFMTYNVFISFPVKKIINLEVKAQYIPNDFPINSTNDFIMYNLRAYYTFKFSKKKEN